MYLDYLYQLGNYSEKHKPVPPSTFPVHVVPRTNNYIVQLRYTLLKNTYPSMTDILNDFGGSYFLKYHVGKKFIVFKTMYTSSSSKHTRFHPFVKGRFLGEIHSQIGFYAKVFTKFMEIDSQGGNR